MERGSTVWRVSMILTGSLLAGVLSGTLEAFGVRDVFAVVVGLAVAVPVIADGMNPDEVLDDRERRVRRGTATILAGLGVGTVAAFALLLGTVDRGVAVGGAAGATYVGGLVVRTWLSREGVDSSSEDQESAAR